MSDEPLDVEAEPEGSLTAIDEVDYDNRDALYEAYRAKRPLVVRDYHRHDPAMQTWSFDSLRARTPEHSVDVDIGNAMVTEGGLQFERVDLHGYLLTLESPADGEQVRYLQAYDLGAQIPDIYGEVSFPHITDSTRRTVTRIWFGPAGTITGYHDDISDNHLSQIVGRKLVKLVSPDQADRMYVERWKYDPNGHVCAVDADDWDRTAHPRFADVEALWTILGPGDTLYNPGGWFHYVRSLDASISVNCLGFTTRQSLIDKPGELFRRLVHNTVARRRECTCHMWSEGKRYTRR